MAKNKNTKKNNKVEKIEIEDLEELNEEEEIEEFLDEDNFEEFEDEEKEVTIMDMLNRIVVCLIIIAIVLAINTIVLICKDGTISNKEANTEISTIENNYSTDNYDVSKMTAVDVKGAVDLFNSKKTYVLYIGKSSCGACVSFLPRLNQVADEYGVTIQYLDINNVAKDSEGYNDLVKKMNFETTVTNNGKEQKGTFGEFLGYTPMTVIIQKGKQVDGAIGAIGVEALQAVFDEYGIGNKK